MKLLMNIKLKQNNTNYLPPRNTKSSTHDTICKCAHNFHQHSYIVYSENVNKTYNLINSLKYNNILIFTLILKHAVKKHHNREDKYLAKCF